MPKLTMEFLVEKLKVLHGDTITIAPGQEYQGVWEPIMFIDKDFGPWMDVPNKIINKGKVHPERGKLNRKKVNMERYGAENPFQSVQIKEKIKQTHFEKYGVEHPSQSEEIQAKKRKTSMERYGEDHNFKAASVRAQIKETMIERYGVAHPAQNKEFLEKMKSTSLSKYGFENPMQNPEVRKKTVKTIQERYGVETAPAQNPEVRKKTIETNLQRYGAAAPMENEEVKAKTLQVVREKYGVDNVFQNEQIKEKSTLSLIEKYGVDHPVHNEEIRAKMIATCKQRYDADSPLESPEIRARIYQTYKERHPELILPDGLTIFEYLRKFDRDLDYTSCKYTFLKFGYDCLREFVENGKEFGKITTLEVRSSALFELPNFGTKHLANKKLPDFQLNDKVYLDVDGLFNHSVYRRKNKRYHFDKRVVYEQSGLRLLQFREDEIAYKSHIVKSMVQNIQGLNIKRYARQCTLQAVPWKEAKDFLKENHLQGPGSPSKCFGLYNEGILVQLIGMKRHDEGKYEILRLCTKTGMAVVGGFGKLLAEVVRQFSPTEILSWCDLRYADGHGYEKMGFVTVRDVLGWKWTDFQSTFNRLKCRANMDERQLTEAQQAEEFGWHKIYDSGQRLYKLLIGNTC